MHNKKHGFTIIEISLVLAIAGLILVMAFVALPALQRQARDAKRKEDTAAFLQALKSYQQNNRGNLPSSLNDGDPYAYSVLRTSHAYFESWDTVNPEENPWAKFYNQYLGEDFKNPNDEKYTFLIQSASSPWWAYDKIASSDLVYDTDLFIFLGGTCENGKPVASSNSRNVAIITKLETGFYCADI